MPRTKSSVVASLPWARPVPDELVKSLSDVFRSDWKSLAANIDADSISAATTLLLAIAHMAVHLLLDGPHIILTNMWPSGSSHFRDKPERGHGLCPSTCPSNKSHSCVTSSAPPDRISIVGPPFGEDYERAYEEALHLGLAGDADVEVYPPGVRGICDRVAQDLVLRLAKDITDGRPLLPYVGTVAAKIKKRRASGHEYSRFEPLDDSDDSDGSDGSDDDVKKPAAKRSKKG